MDSKPAIGHQNNPLRFTQLRIIKNLIVVSLTFVLLFSAYDGLSMLQSTMNGKNGVGSASQAVVYFTFAVSSLVLPKYTIKKLGCKNTLFVGTLLYLPYVTANIYPTWTTMISSAVLIGIGASILWSSQCTYFNESAGLYCGLLEDCKLDIKSPSGESKLGSRNSELFNIQNGIKEGILSAPELKAKEEILNQVPDEVHMKEFRTDSKCSNLKMVLEVNSELIINPSFTKIDSEKIVEPDVKMAKNYYTNDNQFSRIVFSTTPVTSKKPIRYVHFPTKKRSPNSQSEGCIQNELPKYIVTCPNNERTYNNESINSTVKEDNNAISSTVESKSNNIVAENNSRSYTIEAITARFFGCFGTMYYTAQIWSNLISYYVLNINTDENVTFTTNYSCGGRFCNSEYEVLSDGTDEISYETRYLLIGITVALSVIASLLVLVFLDPLHTREENVTFSLSHVMATFNHLKKREQLLIVPLSMFLGMAQGFYTADFTKSYIQCAWSTSHVGLVTVFFGLACGISSTASGFVVKYVGRIPVVVLGLTLHLGIDVFLLFWNPDEEKYLMFYLAAGLWGAMVGVFWAQIQAFYGLLFKKDEEAAFATLYFCSSIGWTIAFTYSNYLCTSTKIYILMIMSCLGVLGYLAADRSFRSRKIKITT